MYFSLIKVDPRPFSGGKLLDYLEQVLIGRTYPMSVLPSLERSRTNLTYDVRHTRPVRAIMFR